MPQVSAALVRSAPSKTIASANIRRDAALSFSRPAAARSSMAVKSLRVTAIAAIVLAPHHTKSSSIQTFSDSGTPTSHPFSPLVSDDGQGADPRRADSGLGGRLVDSFARQLDGQVERVSSNKGTIVSLTLPLREAS